MKFRRIFDVFALHALYKIFWAHFHDLCVQKRSCLPWSSDAFGKFSACNVFKRNLGTFSWFMRSKVKLFAVKLRHILEVLRLQGLQKSFWAQFHDLCVQKLSCLRWSSDAFWKLFACKFYGKSSGHNFSIFASKNEAVCCEVLTHFESTPPASLQKKLWAQFHDLCVQKWSGLLWSSDAFWKLSPFKLYKKSSGRILPIYASKNEAVCRAVQTHFGSSLPASFTEKVLGAIPRFVRPKTKLFSVKFRCILEVLCLQVLKKKFWAQFTIFVLKNETVCCEVQTHYGSFRLASFVEKVLGAFLWFLRPKTKLFAVKFSHILEVPVLRGLRKKLRVHYHDLCIQKFKCF